LRRIKSDARNRAAPQSPLHIPTRAGALASIIDAYRRARYRITATTGGTLPRANCLPADTTMPNFERNAAVPSIAQGFCTLRWHPYLPF